MQCTFTILSSVACPALLYFSTSFHKQHFGGGIIIEHKTRNLIFFTTFVGTSFYRSNGRDMIKNCTLVFMLSTHYFFPVLKKLEFSQQIFEKYSTINFHENLFSGTRIVPCDQTDRHNEVTHFSQFCKRTIKSNWKLNSVISLSQSRSQSVG